MSKERIGADLKKTRFEILRDITKDKLERLEFVNPSMRSRKFFENSADKWACREFLHDIDHIDNIPFSITPDELIDQFINKMDRYSCNHKNKDRAFGFLRAIDMIEGIKEDYYSYIYKYRRK